MVGLFWSPTADLHRNQPGEFFGLTCLIIINSESGIPGPFAFANGIGYDQVNSLVRVVCSHLPGVETIQVDAQMKAGRKLAKIQIPKTVPDGIAILQNGTMLLPCYTPNRIYQISREGRIRVLMDDWFGHTLSNPTNVVLFGKNQNRLMAANFGRWHLTEIKLAP